MGGNDMNVTKTENSFSKMYFRGRIPKAQYHGPILKLTSEDIDKIKFLEKDIQTCKNKISEKELKISKTQNLYYKSRYEMAITSILNHITEIKERIRNIKIARLNIQRQEFDASNIL
jgi:hypothetical protein